MKKPAKNNIGFKARKKISRLSVSMMPWLGALVGLSQIGALGVKHVVLTDEASAQNPALSAAAAKDIQTEINTFDKSTREYFELKAVKTPTKAQQRNLATLEKTVHTLPVSITHRIISDKNLSEEDAAQMLDVFSYVATQQKKKIPDALVALQKGMPYLDDCRTQGANDDAIVACAVQKTADNKHAADMAHIGILLGFPLTTLTIGFTGFALRRRVDEEEKEIKKNEFKSSVDDLRDILTPKALPKKDR